MLIPCENCANAYEDEYGLRWDVDEFGYKAYCPNCGAEM